jgi:hypothetical protein
MTQAVIEIERIVPTPQAGDPTGHFKVNDVRGNRLELVGWALGRRMPVEAVVVVVDGETVASTALDILRPDVGRRFPEVAGAAASGFKLAIEAQGQGRSELEVQIVSPRSSPVSIGRLIVVTSNLP